MYQHRSVDILVYKLLARADAALSKVVRALSAPPASAADMHAYLAGIARSYNVQWTPEYRPSDVSVILVGVWLFSDALSA